eukprot:3578437-Pleurochrysis_carterae.AAC.1
MQINVDVRGSPLRVSGLRRAKRPYQRATEAGRGAAAPAAIAGRGSSRSSFNGVALAAQRCLAPGLSLLESWYFSPPFVCNIKQNRKTHACPMFAGPGSETMGAKAKQENVCDHWCIKRLQAEPLTQVLLQTFSRHSKM